jgi:polar amino acid transport system permease protein
MLSVIENYAPELARAALTTIILALTGGAVALATALPLGLALRSRIPAIRWAARSWVELFRGVSALVLLFFCFYVLPLLGVPLTSFQAATLGLGLNIGAYGADVVKGAIDAVDKGQSEAALALSMSSGLTMRRIILPQAVVMMLPSLATLQIILLKATALASLVAVTELTAQANQIGLIDGHRGGLYMVILVIYFVLAYLLSGVFRLLELRLSKRLHAHGVGA